jgi:hypothetical protein
MKQDESNQIADAPLRGLFQKTIVHLSGVLR